MIKRFLLSNFCSFAEDGELRFGAGKTAPQDPSFCELGKGRASLLMGIFGPNASGKTNIIKGLTFLNQMLWGSHQRLEPDDEIPAEQFLGFRTPKPTRLLAEFGEGQEVYRYETTFTKSTFLTEKLSRRNPKTNAFRSVLTRQSDEAGKVKITTQGAGVTALTLKKILGNRQSASAVSAATQSGVPEMVAIHEAFGEMYTNVGQRGMEDPLCGYDVLDTVAAAEYYRNNDEARGWVGSMLEKADIGFSELYFRQFDPETTAKGFLPMIRHQTEESSFDLPVHAESSGTRRLFMLLKELHGVLTKGGIAVIDDLERDLHSEVVPWLIHLFASPAANPKKAQLVFSCNNPSILRELDKTQITFVQKDAYCVSECFRLDQIEGVRRGVDDFAKKYRAGFYGAQPELDFS